MEKPDNATIVTPEFIKDVKDVKLEWVNIPQWGKGAGVFIRMMTAKLKDGYEHFVQTKLDKKNKQGLQGMRAQLCVRTMCDEDGKLLYDDRKAGVEQLQDKSGDAIDTIFKAAQKMNKLRKQDVDEELKNLETTQEDSSD